MLVTTASARIRSNSIHQQLSVMLVISQFPKPKPTPQPLLYRMLGTALQYEDSNKGDTICALTA